MFSITAFAVALALISLGLLIWHWQMWSRAKRSLLDQNDLLYAQRQFRRRGLASVLSCVLAGLLFYSQEISNPYTIIFFWGGMLLLVVGIALVAVADMANTRWYFRRIQQQQIAEQAALRAELHRLQKQPNHGSNGSNGRQRSNGRVHRPDEQVEQQPDSESPPLPPKNVDVDEEQE